MKTNNDKRYRELFEKRYGQRISDSTWYRLKKTFDDSFPMTNKNVIWLADIKKQIPHLNFRFMNVVSAVKESQKFLKDKSQISGSELLELFGSQGVRVHENTLTKWFKPVHGFSRKRLYNSADLIPVVLAVFLYRLRRNLSITSISR